MVGICGLSFAFAEKEEIKVNINSKDYICRAEYPFLGAADEVYYTYYKKINPIMLKITDEVSGDPFSENN